MPRIKNPNSDGRVVSGLGLVGPGETREVSDELAADLVDGVNFVRVDGPEPATDDQETTPSETPNDV